MIGRILVTGSEGMVGSRFLQLFPKRELLHFPKRIEFDITNPSQVGAILKSYNIATIVNFAAFTNVAEAEKQRNDRNGDCWITNVDGVTNLISVIDPSKTQFIQISADLVFSGSENDPGLYTENHPIERDSEKLTWCGFTKSEAEKLVTDRFGDGATILRINHPLRATFSGKLDYLRKTLKLYNEGTLYPLFSDQQMTVSYVDEICKALEVIILKNHRGVFHASSFDTTTPYDLTVYALEKLGRSTDQVRSISLEEFIAKGNDARRYPKSGGLSSEVTGKKLEMKFSSWREVVDKLISQGLGAE